MNCEVIELNNHRLLCGDATNPCDGSRVTLTVTLAEKVKE